MSMLHRASVLLLAAFAILPLAACGGEASGSGGSTGGGSTGGGSTGGDPRCSDYCKGIMACVDPSECVLVDPAGAQVACHESCAAGFAVLTAAEQSLVYACLSCGLKATPAGQCPLTDLPTSCHSECDSPEAEAAGEKWGEAAESLSSDPRVNCTNGGTAFGGATCSASGAGDTCTIECCNGDCGAAPDVAVQCNTPTAGQATCTCTAGKNKGKTFQADDPCSSDDLWNQCNL